ncbi:MAG: TIGR02206 family membrane protein [Verrucomicrobiota bacterium]|nr:TIGR02206 family membrane protein [Verrucomicrobiota bacterium]
MQSLGHPLSASANIPVFVPYGTAHLVVIALTILLPLAFAGAVRRTKSRALERVIVSILTLILLANYIGYVIFIRGLGEQRWSQMLPMQLCDWAMFAVLVALWTGRPRWFEIAYFWGIGGTLQAIVTPNLQFGFPDFHFIGFFVTHCGIVVGILFLMLAHHLRPQPMSIVHVFLWTEIYFVIALTTDTITDVNYGFLLHKPEAKTLLTALSDNHALYLVEMHLLALVFFTVLYLPFAAADLLRKNASHQGAQG